MVAGKRVLIVLDEAQRLGNSGNLVSKGMKRLVTRPKQKSLPTPASVRIVALTATPYKTSPLNIQNIFNVVAPGLPLVSNGVTEFKDEYASSFWTDFFGQPSRDVREWNHKKLPRLGKRIERYSHIAMKSDPEISKTIP